MSSGCGPLPTKQSQLLNSCRGDLTIGIFQMLQALFGGSQEATLCCALTERAGQAHKAVSRKGLSTAEWDCAERLPCAGRSRKTRPCWPFPRELEQHKTLERIAPNSSLPQRHESFGAAAASTRSCAGPQQIVEQGCYPVSWPVPCSLEQVATCWASSKVLASTCPHVY